MQKQFCCDKMENAVLKGIIDYDNLVNLSDPEFDTFYMEVVKYKKKRNLLLWDSQEIVTEDVILKYCCYCGKEL